jgi:hypothetical protein
MQREDRLFHEFGDAAPRFKVEQGLGTPPRVNRRIHAAADRNRARQARNCSPPGVEESAAAPFKI